MANKPTSKECEVSKQNVCKGSDSQPKPMHPVKRKFSELNNTKTDKRTSIDDDTVVSLMRIKSWLKAHDKSADEVNITDELVQAVIKVKSNATIPDSKSL
ncbi:hypothetical protein OUZ56_003710 [Daphnia magna]|uniref:Uncharacterized protein n=1 Tax=Daphnia magna TaxID=35525 RepID=A0ABR0A9I7_9CRUS|nr:hypothetical protein OUZ56_003710 [Daphnia magna]